MATTPGKPRTSGIPTPGKSSGIPTPGRFRSSSSAASSSGANTPATELDFASQAFLDAIKANDPAQHRQSRTSEASVGSLSPQTTSFASVSGRKSVTGRPSSVASTGHRAAQTRPKPAPPRPVSRQSDVFTRSHSRTGQSFEEGDDVRIESLGFEGVLRFLGEIEGKAGIWAGVELGGGFAGMGKNNGSVGGVQYFSCPLNCGVFVATSKLSPPAIRKGMVSRPSSVASTRSGRTTPSISGRVTPGMSSGRVTPAMSSSRVTPVTPSGRVTPAIRKSTGGVPRTTVATPKSRTTSAETAITPGSIASKYIGMKANQLSARKPAPLTARRSLGSESPTRKAFVSSTASPVRNIGSPFATPRAPSSGYHGERMSPVSSPGKGRLSMKTPKGRVPSAVAMPPPASPSMALSSLAISLNDDFSARSIGSPRPDSSSSLRSTPVHELLDDVSRLQSRLDALEFENQELRESQTEPQPPPEPVDSSAELTTLRTERDDLQSRIATLETSLKAQERSLDERETKIQGLERSMKETALDISKIKSDNENRVRDLQAKLDDSDSLNKNLKELLEAKEGKENASDAVLTAKSTEISVLEGRVEKVYKELEEERRELGSQVDELRKAGQETIALYEERLSASETRRYEMEDHIAALEDQLRSSARPPSPSMVAAYASSAAQIDNETMKEQAQHLQKKIASLEDMLEDARAAAERDEATVLERIKRYKDKEELLKKEASDCKKEIERLSRSEDLAKQRLSESEEAFRENAVTLENARAEIEVLRGELSNMEDSSTGTDRALRKSSDLALKDHDEVDFLRKKLEEASAEKENLNQILQSVAREVETHQLALDQEQESSEILRQELEERVAELDTLRKKANREVTVNSSQESKHHSSASKNEAFASREEVTGLKHIIQELQKENQSVAQQNKLMESENKLLMTETEQLRQDLKILEDNVEASILREEESLARDEASSPLEVQNYSEDLQKVVQELKTKHETEMDQLRKRLADIEMKNARTVHDLHKEISELESLVESKIYREDDLEREVERLREKLSKTQKKTSRSSMIDVMNGVPLATEPAGDDVCEICEQPGHDIFSCSLLKDDSAAPPKHMDEDEELVCEDCEGRGHVAANCPHSLDVF